MEKHKDMNHWRLALAPQEARFSEPPQNGGLFSAARTAKGRRWRDPRLIPWSSCPQAVSGTFVNMNVTAN